MTQQHAKRETIALERVLTLQLMKNKDFLERHTVHSQRRMPGRGA